MQTRSTMLLFVAVLLPATARSSPQVLAQDAAPAREARAQEARQGGATSPAGEDPHPLLASDGQPVLPGRVPDKTSEPAQRLWQAFRAAQSPSTGPRAPIHGFRLGFSLRLREKDQSNDGHAYFAFEDQHGWISCQMASSGRTLLQGPDGPFLIDGAEVVKLKGREGKDDRRRLEEWISIARNFLALAQPERVRLVELRAIPQEEVVPFLTAKLAARASELDWLEVRSPDFHLYSSVAESAAMQPVFRARMGLCREPPARTEQRADDPAPHDARRAGELVLAILHEEREGKIVPASLQVIEVRKQAELAGYRLPADLAVWRASEEQPNGTMAYSPYVELWLEADGQIDPPFGPDDFRPQRK